MKSKIISALAAALLLLLPARPAAAEPPVTRPATMATLATDAALLDELSRRSFLFFWEQAGEESGLIADRARADGSTRFDVASIASTGFGLTALCVADERGWTSPGAALERVRKTLRFVHDDLPHHKGFYYHFVDIDTGERRWGERAFINRHRAAAGRRLARPRLLR